MQKTKQFTINKEDTLSSLKGKAEMYFYCRENIERFSNKKTIGTLKGGFMKFDKPFTSEEAVEKINNTEGIRLGTPLEALKYRIENDTPDYFCVLSEKNSDGEVLFWSGDFAEFGLFAWGGQWRGACRVFFVATDDSGSQDLGTGTLTLRNSDPTNVNDAINLLKSKGYSISETTYRPEEVISILKKISNDTGYDFTFENVDITIRGRIINLIGKKQ